jgi:hypothetical protein
MKVCTRMASSKEEGSFTFQMGDSNIKFEFRYIGEVHQG